MAQAILHTYNTTQQQVRVFTDGWVLLVQVAKLGGTKLTPIKVYRPEVSLIKVGRLYITDPQTSEQQFRNYCVTLDLGKTSRLDGFTKAVQPWSVKICIIKRLRQAFNKDRHRGVICLFAYISVFPA